MANDNSKSTNEKEEADISKQFKDIQKARLKEERLNMPRIISQTAGLMEREINEY